MAFPAAILSSVAAQEALADPQDKFDGSFIDSKVQCGEPCVRNINAGGGFATIQGRDAPDQDQWDVFAEYQGKDIFVDFSSAGGPKKLKGTWTGKLPGGGKGIKWADGNIWEKMEYKLVASPYEIIQKAGQMRAMQLEKGEIKDRR